MMDGRHERPVKIAGLLAALALAAMAAAHIIWIFSPWPLATWTDWNLLFYGVPELPEGRASALPLAIFTILWGLAAYVIAALSGNLHAIGPRLFYRVAPWMIAAILLLHVVHSVGGTAYKFLTDPAAQWTSTTFFYMFFYVPFAAFCGAVSIYVAVKGATRDKAEK